MSYFTERHGLRAPVERTESISIEMYTLLFDCCKKYFDNIAWKYPNECPDGNGCCGLSPFKLNTAMKFEIPTLFRNSHDMIDAPQKGCYNNDEDAYDQFALLDFIELIANEAKDIKSRDWHNFFHHDDLDFATTQNVVADFRNEINSVFEKTGLQYRLSSTGMVERIVEHTPITQTIEAQIEQIPEKGIRELLHDAIVLFKTPNPSSRKDSVEKIWDALERLKTYYSTLDKRKSAEKIVKDMSNGCAELETLFGDEFLALTKIGNSYRIRHHETDKIEINDLRHLDYFFNRCLSLIALAIQYLH